MTPVEVVRHASVIPAEAVGYVEATVFVDSAVAVVPVVCAVRPTNHHGLWPTVAGEFATPPSVQPLGRRCPTPPPVASVGFCYVAASIRLLAGV